MVFHRSFPASSWPATSSSMARVWVDDKLCGAWRRPNGASESNSHKKSEATTGLVRRTVALAFHPSITAMATVRIHFPENESPTVLSLAGSRISVGRLPHNTIQIIDRTISALHAEFIREGDHYRLHDRGSSNGTFVNGEAVADYHLREACRISFGAFECEFSPALAPAQAEDTLENLPSRGEINEVRHDNAKLRNQLELLREEVETLSKAPAVESGSGADAVPREEFARVVGQVEKLKGDLLQSGEEVKRLKNNLAVLQRDRGNLQRALDDTRAELVRSRLTPAPVGSARAIPSDEAVTAPVETEPVETEESPEAAAPTPAPEETAPAFKPAPKPAVEAPRPPTVTRPQPFVPVSAPKAQPGSGSGIRPFPKANPPSSAPKPALSEAGPPAQAPSGPPAQAPRAKPSPFPPPINPFAKASASAPTPAGPKGTQKITVPPPN
jgi:FHA domain